MMTEARFRQGSLSARVFFREQKNVMVVAAHGDTSQHFGRAKVWIGFAELYNKEWR